MKSYRLRPRALRDLDEIWDFTAANRSPAQAETYLRQIQQALQILAADPGIGVSCEEIRAGYRKFPAGSHVIFYRRADGGVEIIRILHQRMDVGQNF